MYPPHPKPLLLMVTAALLVAGCSPPPDTQTAEGKPDGRKLYNLYCSGCHGPDGKRGDDAAMRIVEGAPLASEAMRKVIEEGRPPGMPAWKAKLKPDQVTAVVDHVRSLQQ